MSFGDKIAPEFGARIWRRGKRDSEIVALIGLDKGIMTLSEGFCWDLRVSCDLYLLLTINDSRFMVIHKGMLN